MDGTTSPGDAASDLQQKARTKGIASRDTSGPSEPSTNSKIEKLIGAIAEANDPAADKGQRLPEKAAANRRTANHPPPGLPPPPPSPLSQNLLQAHEARLLEVPGAVEGLISAELGIGPMPTLEFARKADGNQPADSSTETRPSTTSTSDASTRPVVSQQQDAFTFQMQPNSQTWNFAYEDESGSLPHRLGFLYVRHLIEHPEQPATAQELEMIKAEFAGKELPLTMPQADDVMDDKARKDAKEKLRETITEIERAKKENRAEGLAYGELCEEKSKLTQYLSRATKPGQNGHGVAVKLGDASRARANSIGKAIKEALAALTDYGFPNLAAHVKANYSRSSGSFIYRGRSDWLT